MIVGIAIFTVFRTGMGWSAASGSGVVLARLPDGSWSAPSGILLHTLGVGFLIGADIYDVVLILRTQRAVESFTNPKVSLGAELSIAAGPLGNGAMLESGIERSPAWSYTKSKGFYAGIQLDGNIVIERNDENARFYGRKGIKAKDILSGNIHRPHECDQLIRTIERASGETRTPPVVGSRHSMANYNPEEPQWSPDLKVVPTMDSPLSGPQITLGNERSSTENAYFEETSAQSTSAPLSPSSAVPAYTSVAPVELEKENRDRRNFDLTL